MPTEPRTHVPGPSDGVEEPFVGRRRELKALTSSLEAARSGEGRLDIVVGAPGIGKTRLAREVAALASERGMRVLRGGCWEGEGAPAYWPWTDVLRSALGAAAEERVAAAADFDRLLQAAATQVGIPPAGPIDVSHDAQQARFMLFHRYGEFLAVTAGAQPALVIVDDVHWADTGSLLLLQFLAARLADLPLALLITSREPVSEMAASAGRHAWARQLALGGLSRSEAGALIEARLARSPAPAVLDRLMRLTEGNPYFLKELGQLLVGGERDPDPGGSVALPASLLVMALQHYHRLSLPCRTLLQAAAVIGQEFDSELAAAAAGLPQRDVLARLDEAVERRIVTALGAARYRFRHALLREAVHGQLHLSDRAHLHERIASALERRAAAGERVPSATLAHHFYMGLPLTDRHRAATHAVAAGQDAHRACAFEEAVFQLRRAHELSGATFSDLDACDLLLLLGAAEAGAGDWARSRRTFEDAAALSRRIDCPERLARAALGFRGMMLATIPVDVEAVSLLKEAQAALRCEHLELSAELYAAMSLALYFGDDPDPVHNYSNLAMDVARSLGNDRLTAVALSTRTMANLRPDGVSLVQHDADELLRLGLRLRDPMISIHARICRYWVFLSRGDAHQAAQELARATQIAVKTRHPRPLWQVALMEASHAIARGQSALIPTLIARARDLGRRVHESSPAQHSLIQSFQHARLTKDLTTWFTAISESPDSYPGSTGYLAAQAFLQAEFGRTAESRATLGILRSRGFQDFRKDGYYLYALASLSEVAVTCECLASANLLYSLLEPYRSLSIVAGWGTVLDGSVSHYLGILARYIGDFRLSREHFDKALQANVALNAPLLLARTQLEYARLWLSHPTHESSQHASELASAAALTFSELGLEPHRIQAERIAEDLAPIRSTPLSVAGRSHTSYTPVNSLIRNGDLWMLTFDASTAHIRHRLGLHYIALIIGARGEPLHVLDLLESLGAAPPERMSDSGDTVDHIARREYKARLKSLELEIQLATDNNDLGQLQRLQHERSSLIQELSRSYGISGNRRPSRSPAERARISVKNRITAALEAIRPHHPTAFQHLRRSLITGTYCRYSPTTPTEWDL